jgi:mannose-6-phosphate isomerase-like protein (cupin superfamily)
MRTFELSKLIEKRSRTGHPYLGFLRVPSLSLGLYALPVGSEDLQTPHSEDEVYYVVEGRATIIVGEEERAVHEGSIVYVEAGVDHRFDSIEDDLTLLVFFAPAEGSRAGGGAAE